MPYIYDWAVREAERTTTVADLRALKGSERHYVQVTADSAEEAAAAEQAGVEMVITRARNVRAVRQGAKRLFVTAALGFTEAITQDDILRAAINALTSGADAVITGRALSTVEMLAAEGIPVMGHLGMVPRQSSWFGGVRALGKTADEAMALYRRFQRLESAGAFAVEVEIVTAEVMAEINRRSGLVTISLGSGSNADVLFQFTTDLCGEQSWTPRHARTYGDIGSLRRCIDEERHRAMTAFREDVAGGGYPAAGETANMDDDAHAQFVDLIERTDA